MQPHHLIWLDMEMTGLKVDQDFILELAIVITDRDLNKVAESPHWVVQQTQATLQAMDAWNTKHHGESGLIDLCLKSQLTVAQVEAEALQFLAKYLEPQESPMCGNSICQDRRFLARWMPQLEKFFHYRNLDVSSLKILAQLWAPHLPAMPAKASKHRAYDDIIESIAELKHYRQHLLHGV